jgi:hypothetical protein
VPPRVSCRLFRFCFSRRRQTSFPVRRGQTQPARLAAAGKGWRPRSFQFLLRDLGLTAATTEMVGRPQYLPLGPAPQSNRAKTTAAEVRSYR